jgi:hypothetical protein
LARVTARRLGSRLLGCALSQIALFVPTPPLYLLALLFVSALFVLAPLLYVLALALTPLFVLVVAVRVRGPPPLADVATDVPQLVPYTHLALT